MAVNSAFNQQSASSPVPGGYAQPSAGITEQLVTPADPSGNAYQTSLASGGVANLQTANYRDSQATVQAGSKATSPSSGGTVVSITPGTAGLWEISGSVGIAGTTVSATDSNNFALNVGTVPSIAAITYSVQSTTGGGAASLPATILNLTGSSVVNITAVAGATSGAIYSGTLVARRVG